jgi:hypothetical protein
LSRLFVLAFGVLALLIPVAVGARPVAGEPVAVIGSPFRSQAEELRIVAAAGGDIVQTVNRFVTIAKSDDVDFIAKLYAAGAIGVIRSSILSGCLPANPTIVEEQA